MSSSTHSKNDPFSSQFFEGRVRSMSSEGQGVVEGPEGKVYFVPAVWVGDLAKFKIIESKKNYGFARLLELIEPSEFRVEAPCPHSGWNEGQCGACPWQFVSYEAQLEAKNTRVEHSLSRLLGDELKKIVKPIWASPLVWGYRNRAQFKTDGKQLGFVSHSSQKLAPIEDCLVLSDLNRGALKKLLHELPQKSWMPRVGKAWNTVDVDEALALEWQNNFKVSEVTLNQRRPFLQANDAQNLTMKDWIKERVSSLDRSLNVLELFAGSGNFTEVLAEVGFAKICAVEVVEEALVALKSRGLKNVETEAADLFLSSSYSKLRLNFDKAEILILDPPRDGLKDKSGLFESFPEIKYVGYVSCDLATFVRDLKDFIEAGFRVVEVQPLDQFPHTPHIELMAWLEH